MDKATWINNDSRHVEVWELQLPDTGETVLRVSRVSRSRVGCWYYALVDQGKWGIPTCFAEGTVDTETAKTMALQRFQDDMHIIITYHQAVLQAVEAYHQAVLQAVKED